MTADFERKALEALDEALEWTLAEREFRLAMIDGADPKMGDRLRSLLRADDAAQDILATEPPEPAAYVDMAPPEQIGVYRLTALLGEGGMGAVFRGERNDGLFDQVVAVKLMRPGLFAASAMTQFATERRVLARLRHPNIAQLFDGGADAQGRAYFIMELVNGEPFTEYVRSRDLDLRAAAALVLPLCAAILHAHQALVVHADIKPSNILIDAEGRPKLLDFGIARNLQEEDDGQGHGLTLAYASPQRRLGKAPTTADDIYALGALLWELASGEHPSAAPPGLLGPDIPPEFAAIVAKATTHDPAFRYDSAGALADDIRRWLGHFPVRALPPRFSRTARLLVARRPYAVMAGATAAMAVVAAFIVISVLYVSANTERREAERRFQQARNMSHYMLFDLFDRLSDTPGTLAVRRELADKARTYLQDLSASAHAPIEVKAETAVGYMQLAGVEGMFTAGQLGERSRADVSLQAAQDLLADGGEAAKNNPRWQHAQGRLKLFQGFRAFDQGGEREALPLLRQATKLLAAASARLPDDPEVAVDLWQARLTLGDALGEAGDYKGELAIVSEALTDYQRRASVYDRHEKTPLLFARSHGLVGDALYYTGDPPAAAKSYATSEGILVAEDKLRPRRTRTLMELMDARWNLASTLAELGRTDRALKLYDLGIATGRERLRLEPDNDGLQRMANLLELERAALLAKLGRTGEAMTAAAQNLALRRERLARQPKDSVARRNYLAGLRQVAEIEAAAGRADAACAHYREAKSGYEAYLREFTLTRQAVDVELATIRQKVAACG